METNLVEVNWQSKVRRALHGLGCTVKKLTTKVRGHFVTLNKIDLHLIERNHEMFTFFLGVGVNEYFND